MRKIGHVLIVIGMVIASYLLMLVVIPDVVVPMVETANVTMTASSNLTQYPGASEAMVAAPWVLWFVPAVIGTILIVMIVRQP